MNYYGYEFKLFMVKGILVRIGDRRDLSVLMGMKQLNQRQNKRKQNLKNN